MNPSLNKERLVLLDFLKNLGERDFTFHKPTFHMTKKGIINLKLPFQMSSMWRISKTSHDLFLFPSFNSAISAPIPLILFLDSTSKYSSPSALSLWPKGYQVKIKQDMWTSNLDDILQ